MELRHSRSKLLMAGPTTGRPGGLHSWSDDDIGNVAAWGIRLFSPGELPRQVMHRRRILDGFPLISA
ncbi:hypothetical protein [Nonomuraea helvata]|uniref:Uncharacterized protein n=1 Tax=Nonomuraea helvata TaxID=37484 RepID=A0ABV5RXW8_9ACTN